MMLNTIYRLFKKKYFLFILLIVMLFAVMGEGYHFLILSNMKSMTVSLNYPGAEQGLNPDGSRFNISEMSDDEILNEAKKGLKIENNDNEKIKSRIFITTKFSQKAMENVVSDIRGGMRGPYVPTTYYIYYSQKNKFAVNETYEFLQALATGYEKYFTKKHAENNSILHFSSDGYDFSSYDYSEIYTVLYNKADEMLNLVVDHRNENRSFRSEDNLNFDTVRDELSNFKNVKLEKFHSYVIQNSISKDRPGVMNKLEYLKDKSAVDYEKLSDKSEIEKKALNMYDPKITAIAFVPSVDNTNSYYMSRTKTGIDDLAKNSYESGMDAAKISKKLDGYLNRYSKLSKASDTPLSEKEYTDAYLNRILKDFEELSQKICNLDDEYLKYKTENYFTYKIGEKQSVIGFAAIVKFSVIGFIFAFLIVLYMEFAHSFIYRKTKSAKKAIAVMTKLKSEGNSK